MSKKCTDHLGNEFNTINEMCEHYGIDRFLYRDRKKEGWSLERILTTPRGLPGWGRGEEYNMLKKIADDNNISYRLVKQRYDNGLRGKALANSSQGRPKAKEVFDHLGNKYTSIQAKQSTTSIEYLA